jgi:UDP-glucose 4-epimerase
MRTAVSTANLLDWLRLESPRTVMVAASTAAVYGAGHDGAIPESAPTSPFSPYGHHKLIMEEICRSYSASYGLQTVVARLFSVYGSGLRKQLLWDLCTKLSRGPEPAQLGGTGAELRDWIEVRDAAAALERLAGSAGPAAPVVNVGTGRATSVRAIADTVLSCWPAPRSVAFTGALRAGDPVNLVADSSKLATLGIAPTIAVAEGIRGYVAWYLRQGAETQ